MKTPRVFSYIAGVVLLVFAVLLFFRLPSAGVISAVGGVIVLISTARSSREKVEKTSGPAVSVPTASVPTVAPPVEEPSPEQELGEGVKMVTFLGAGMYFKMDNFNHFGTPNPLYDYSRKELIESDIVGERVYKYSYNIGKITFEDEPTNEVDPNAIKILSDGIHIGYIKKGSTSRLRNIMKKNVLAIEATAGGGNYKEVYEDGDSYSLEKGDSKYWLRIVIRYREV